MFQEAHSMSIMEERIESAFLDELLRIKHEGMDSLLHMRLDALLYQVYRRGYVRGHSDRSKEVHLDEEQARREGKYPMGVNIKYEGDRLILDGKDITPRTQAPPPTRLPAPEYRPELHTKQD
jgi:hypothetical protein